MPLPPLDTEPTQRLRAGWWKIPADGYGGPFADPSLRRLVKQGGLVYDPTPEQQEALEWHQDCRRVLLLGGIQVPPTGDGVLFTSGPSAPPLSPSVRRVTLKEKAAPAVAEGGFCDVTVVHQLCLMPPVGERPVSRARTPVGKLMSPTNASALPGSLPAVRGHRTVLCVGVVCFLVLMYCAACCCRLSPAAVSLSFVVLALQAHGRSQSVCAIQLRVLIVPSRCSVCQRWCAHCESHSTGVTLRQSCRCTAASTTCSRTARGCTPASRDWCDRRG